MSLRHRKWWHASDQVERRLRFQVFTWAWNMTLRFFMLIKKWFSLCFRELENSSFFALNAIKRFVLLVVSGSDLLGCLEYFQPKAHIFSLCYLPTRGFILINTQINALVLCHGGNWETTGFGFGGEGNHRVCIVVVAWSLFLRVFPGFHLIIFIWSRLLILLLDKHLLFNDWYSFVTKKYSLLPHISLFLTPIINFLIFLRTWNIAF